MLMLTMETGQKQEWLLLNTLLKFSDQQALRLKVVLHLTNSVLASVELNKS